MNRGSLGVRELNQRLQRLFNPPKPDEPVVEEYGWRFQIQDKVIQTENNYEKEVFNGDIGTIESIDPIEHEVSIRFDGRLVTYDFGELDEVSLAYAVTIHKSQGSGYWNAYVAPKAKRIQRRERTLPENPWRSLLSASIRAAGWVASCSCSRGRASESPRTPE
jgi:ATP-dependent exoDNAse (exonuclease V) alpha subunit